MFSEFSWLPYPGWPSYLIYIYFTGIMERLLNRICAMVVDIRPAAGAAVSLEEFFGA